MTPEKVIKSKTLPIRLKWFSQMLLIALSTIIVLLISACSGGGGGSATVSIAGTWVTAAEDITYVWEITGPDNGFQVDEYWVIDGSRDYMYSYTGFRSGSRVVIYWGSGQVEEGRLSGRQLTFIIDGAPTTFVKQ